MTDKKYKNIGESLLGEYPKKSIGLIIKDKAIKPQHLSDELTKVLDNNAQKIKDLQEQIITVGTGGALVSNVLGQDTRIGVSQKTVTDNIDRLWKKIESITGESLRGVKVDVTPDFMIINSPTTVNISASVENAFFDYLRIYFDGVLVGETSGVSSYKEDFEVSNLLKIKVVASILGVEYIQEKDMQTFSSGIYIGSGANPSEVLSDVSNYKPFSSDNSEDYEVTVTESNKIYIIIPKDSEDQINSIKMSGFDVPVTKTSQGLYNVYTTVNTYKEGTYSLNIK